MSEDTIFSLEELTTFKNNEKVRQNMVSAIVKDGVPDDPEVLTVLLRTVDSSDTAIFKKKNTNIKDAANKSSNAVSALVSELLLGVDARSIVRNNDNPVVLSNKDSDIKILPGEADTGIVDIDYDDFKKD